MLPDFYSLGYLLMLEAAKMRAGIEQVRVVRIFLQLQNEENQ